VNLKKPTKGFTKTNLTKKSSLEFPTTLNNFFIFGATQAVLALEKREKITHVGSKENCIYFAPSGALVFWGVANLSSISFQSLFVPDRTASKLFISSFSGRPSAIWTRAQTPPTQPGPNASFDFTQREPATS